MTEQHRQRGLKPFTRKGEFGAGLRASGMGGIVERHGATSNLQSAQAEGAT